MLPEQNNDEPQTSIGEVSSKVWEELMGDAQETPEQHEHLDLSRTESPKTQEEEEPASSGGESDEPVVHSDTVQTFGDAEDEGNTEGWSETETALYSGLSPEQKQFFDSQLSQRSEKLKEFEGYRDSITVGQTVEKNISPEVRQHLEQRNIAPQTFVYNLMEWHKKSLTDPKGFAKQVVETLGVDPSELFGLQKDPNYKEPPKDPNADRIAALEKAIHDDQVRRENEARQRVSQTIEQVATEKDDAGNLVRPHFEKVRTKMGKLMMADKDLTLTSAYDAAVMLDPKLRLSVVPKTEQKPAMVTDDRKIKEAKKLAAAAKANIKGGDSTKSNKATNEEARDLRSVLNNAADQLEM